jgi:1,4-alpha-glucan branching enzyme
MDKPAEKQTAKPIERPAEKVSAKAGEKPIEFVLKGTQAKSVLVAGTFNNWDPKRTPMRKDGNGGWKATVSLPPGRHEYRFVADGQWITDPNAKEQVRNPYGSTNSVVVV